MGDAEPTVIPYVDLTVWCDRWIGPGDWVSIEQSQIDLFARATGDHQWIHVDPERAAAGPFGTTIAHGYLVLSLAPTLMARLYRFDGVAMAVNYGLDRVRFVSPVPSGSRLRTTFKITAVRQHEECADVSIHAVVELEGAERPACVIDSVRRLYPAAQEG